MAAELAVAGNGDDVVQGSTDTHLLELGGEVFTCAGGLPFGTMMKYAKDDTGVESLAEIMRKLVNEDEHDRMWDAFDRVGLDGGVVAIQKVMESYIARPTEPVSPSSAGPKRTRRK